MDWLTKTDWPSDLQQFIEEFACSPLATNSKKVDSHQLSQLAKLHARNTEDASCLAAALYLVPNDLDASHELSQDNHSVIGSYLHGIMHRRERDFSNAKYWFHQAGEMNCFEDVSANLAPATIAWLKETQGHWQFDPVQLTDWHRSGVDKYNRGQLEDTFKSAIEDIAWQEWRCITNTVIKSPR